MNVIDQPLLIRWTSSSRLSTNLHKKIFNAARVKCPLMASDWLMVDHLGMNLVLLSVRVMHAPDVKQ